ncbi:MAG: hypothetical protein P8P74_18520 [Crocinitomicaceae bacterium]|nr:hypothetical protein [Crocinitomicaceae bacterium]
MKHLLFVIFLSLGAFANAQDTTFSIIYEPWNGTLSYNYVPVTDADVVWDEGLITSGVIAFQRRTFLARIDSNGNLLWQN